MRTRIRRNTSQVEITGDEVFAPQRLKLYLRAVPNPDYSSGYNADVSIPWHEVPVASLDQASRLVGEFIADNDLGGGNFAAGGVTRDGQPYAKISYNGRIWRWEPSFARFALPARAARVRRPRR